MNTPVIWPCFVWTHKFQRTSVGPEQPGSLKDGLIDSWHLTTRHSPRLHQGEAQVVKIKIHEGLAPPPPKEVFFFLNRQLLKYFLYLFSYLQLYCPIGISPVGNSGCFLRGKQAATESRYPIYSACRAWHGLQDRKRMQMLMHAIAHGSVRTP